MPNDKEENEKLSKLDSLSLNRNFAAQKLISEQNYLLSQLRGLKS